MTQIKSFFNINHKIENNNVKKEKLKVYKKNKSIKEKLKVYKKDESIKKKTKSI